MSSKVYSTRELVLSLKGDIASTSALHILLDAKLKALKAADPEGSGAHVKKILYGYEDVAYSNKPYKAGDKGRNDIAFSTAITDEGLRDIIRDGQIEINGQFYEVDMAKLDSFDKDKDSHLTSLLGNVADPYRTQVSPAR